MSDKDSNLIVEVNKLNYYLQRIKQDLDKFDETHSLEERDNYVERLYPEFKIKMDEHFTKTSKMFDQYDKATYKTNQEYYIKAVWEYLYSTIINRHIYDKPLGYPGDFILMNYILDYQDKFIGDTSYEKLINRYSLRLPFCVSNIARKEYLKSLISSLANQKKNLSVTSVACGSIRELLDIRANTNIKEINCIDFEPKVFEYIKSELSKQPFSNGTKVEFLLKDIVEMAKGKEIQALIKDQDLIYFSGIFDYLPDRIAKKVCGSFFPLLKEGGIMMICNSSRKNKKLHSYYEVLGKWEMVYRDEADLMTLVSDLAPKRCHFERPMNGEYYDFLVLVKE